MTNEVSEINISSIEDNLLEFQSDINSLNEIVVEFMRCIREQDKTGFLKLFYKENTPWLGKFDKTSEEAALSNNPDVVNPLGIFDISKNTFISSMVNPPASLRFEERFENLKIDTDGLVASLSFDYEMFVNDSPIKNGRELWQVIKSNEGWKIVSVVHSIKF